MGDFIVLALLGVALFFVIRSMLKNKGGCSCGCSECSGCSGCGGSCSCGDVKKETTSKTSY